MKSRGFFCLRFWHLKQLLEELRAGVKTEL